MKLDMTILYVTDVAGSTDFFQKALGLPPAEVSPGFALFLVPGGVKLGLWKRDAVKPAVSGPGLSCELVLHVDEEHEVERLHDGWKAQGLAIADPPTRREFGYSFTAEGPDGERLRVLKAEG